MKPELLYIRALNKLCEYILVVRSLTLLNTKMQVIRNDITAVSEHFNLYYSLAKHDISNRFRRSKLGILWIVLQQLIFVLGASVIWSNIFNMEIENFMPFLVTGMAIWGFLVSSMVEGCSIFVVSQGYLKNFCLPESIFVFRALIANFFYFLLNILTASLVLIAFNKFSFVGIIYALPGILILIIYFYAASGTMAYLGLRYRDLNHALSSIFSLLFVLTPVMFTPEMLLKKGISIIVYLNPFASLLEIIRYPLLNHNFPEYHNYLIAIGFTSLLIGIYLTLKQRWKRFIPFWL